MISLHLSTGWLCTTIRPCARTPIITPVQLDPCWVYVYLKPPVDLRPQSTVFLLTNPTVTFHDDESIRMVTLESADEENTSSSRTDTYMIFTWTHNLHSKTLTNVDLCSHSCVKLCYEQSFQLMSLWLPSLQPFYNLMAVLKWLFSNLMLYVQVSFLLSFFFFKAGTGLKIAWIWNIAFTVFRHLLEFNICGLWNNDYLVAGRL